MLLHTSSDIAVDLDPCNHIRFTEIDAPHSPFRVPWTDTVDAFKIHPTW